MDDHIVSATDISSDEEAGSSSIFSIILSCLTIGSSEAAFEFFTDVGAASTSIFLLLPFGAGSRGVRQ
jgi:hypothetical protein